jgi:hypothetical protein
VAVFRLNGMITSLWNPGFLSRVDRINKDMKRIALFFIVLMFCSGFTSKQMKVTHKESLSEIDKYKLQIMEIIQENWGNYKEFIKTKGKLEATMIVVIIPDGKITEIKFEKSSGDKQYDDFAYQSIIQAVPFPPLPESYTQPDLKIGVVFSEAGESLSNVLQQMKRNSK